MEAASQMIAGDGVEHADTEECAADQQVDDVEHGCTVRIRRRSTPPGHKAAIWICARGGEAGYFRRRESAMRPRIASRTGRGVAKFSRAKPAYCAPKVSPKFSPTRARSRKNCPAGQGSASAEQSS